MNIGNKISEGRKTRHYSQEELAKRLGVSRSAVAKWENNNGIPDVENLKLLAREFQVTVDYLLSDAEEDEGWEHSDHDQSNPYYASYQYRRCYIELDDWNIGASKAYIVGQDLVFLYYVILYRRKRTVGAVAKEHITGIALDGKGKKDMDFKEYMKVDKNYFQEKCADISLDDKHIWSGIFGEDTELLGVHITEMTDDFVKIEPGTRRIALKQIVKIELSEELQQSKSV